MRIAEVIAGLIMTGVVLYYVFNSNSTSVITALGQQTSGFVGALQGRTS